MHENDLNELASIAADFLEASTKVDDLWLIVVPGNNISPDFMAELRNAYGGSMTSAVFLPKQTSLLFARTPEPSFKLYKQLAAKAGALLVTMPFVTVQNYSPEEVWWYWVMEICACPFIVTPAGQHKAYRVSISSLIAITKLREAVERGALYPPGTAVASQVSPQSDLATATDISQGKTEPANDLQSAKKAKRSTAKGEAQAKLVATLTKHHKYADGGCLNLAPIGNNDLARLADVDQSTASAFFKKQFNGHRKYKAACADAGGLAAALKLLNGEFAPHLLFGSKPADEVERDEE